MTEAREAFEAWHHREYGWCPAFNEKTQNYSSVKMQGWWRIWQAAYIAGTGAPR